MLGGSGSINGMVFVRGNQRNYDDWAEAGCKGWSFRDVLPSFKRMEDWEDGASELRGGGGPVRVTRQRDLTGASEKFIEAMAATAGVGRIDDYNGASQEGVSVMQQNAAGGLRYSSSIGYLDGQRSARPDDHDPHAHRADRHRERPRRRRRGHHGKRAGDVRAAKEVILPRASSARRNCSCCPASARPRTCASTASTSSPTCPWATTCTITCSSR